MSQEPKTNTGVENLKDQRKEFKIPAKTIDFLSFGPPKKQ